MWVSCAMRRWPLPARVSARPLQLVFLLVFVVILHIEQRRANRIDTGQVGARAPRRAARARSVLWGRDACGGAPSPTRDRHGWSPTPPSDASNGRTRQSACRRRIALVLGCTACAVVVSGRMRKRAARGRSVGASAISRREATRRQSLCLESWRPWAEQAHPTGHQNINRSPLGSPPPWLVATPR